MKAKRSRQTLKKTKLQNRQRAARPFDRLVRPDELAQRYDPHPSYSVRWLGFCVHSTQLVDMKLFRIPTSSENDESYTKERVKGPDTS